MELRQLRYYVAVAEELHFRRAAESLHIAQPAVSEQVRKLEEELGVTLLDRGHGRVSLTDAGAALLEEAKRVLSLADGARHVARSACERSAARLRVGYSASALPAAVPRALHATRAVEANTQTSLRPGPVHALLEAVREGRLEVAVVPLPVAADGLRTVRIGYQSAVAAMPVDHRHSGERLLHLNKLAPERVMVLPREANRPFYDGVISSFKELGLSPTLVELPDEEIEQALLAVASGAVLALLPEAVAERYAAPGVRFVRFAGRCPAFVTGAITRRGREHPPTASFLRALRGRMGPPRIPVPDARPEPVAV
jgi:DNA-binding transcriptional LysR family regulator